MLLNKDPGSFSPRTLSAPVSESGLSLEGHGSGA